MKSDHNNITTENTEEGFSGLVGLFTETQNAMQMRAARAVDTALVVRNWLFGWYIVEFENGGAERAELYGQKLLKRLSKELKKTGLKGMSLTNLKQFRLFYETYKKIGQALPDQSFESKQPAQDLSLSFYASEYQLYLPSKEELQKQLEEVQKAWEDKHGEVK